MRDLKLPEAERAGADDTSLCLNLGCSLLLPAPASEDASGGTCGAGMEEATGIQSSMGSFLLK